MPRRIYTYRDGLGWEGLNIMVSLGSLVFGLGTAITLANFVWSRWKGRQAGNDPWEADSLEWSITSPPPEYNFAAIPVVASAHPLWDQKPLPHAESGAEDETRGLGPEGAVERETPVTSGIDTRPEGNLVIPTDTYLPLGVAAGLTVLFLGLLVNAAAVAIAGAGLAVVALVWWAWRTEEDLK
jgi:cytochrome c oxidase subunit 1/cytochrome c oxidase subunit I+III